MVRNNIGSIAKFLVSASLTELLIYLQYIDIVSKPKGDTLHYIESNRNKNNRIKDDIFNTIKENIEFGLHIKNDRVENEYDIYMLYQYIHKFLLQLSDTDYDIVDKAYIKYAQI